MGLFIKNKPNYRVLVRIKNFPKKLVEFFPNKTKQKTTESIQKEKQFFKKGVHNFVFTYYAHHHGNFDTRTPISACS